jgi:aspartyl-tRNA(Asn)/glutamyl-tRNA(Gln) amidotransferase subunit A
VTGGNGAFDTARRCRGGRQSPVRVVEEALARIDRVEPQIESVLHLAREEALVRARKLEEEGPSADGDGLLFGVPLAIKDNICVKDQPASCGSRILAGYRPSYSATVIERAIAEGAVPIARTNMDEFAMGSSTENSAFKTTYNPWDRSSSPGGSSGGSAAIVAAGAVPLALGSDTGGSIRQPAALCGVVGFKPTYGTVSRYGLIAFASSFDQIGPMARDVRDTALLFEAIAGHDRRDSTSIPGYRPDVFSRLDDGIEGIRIGVPERFADDGIEEEIAEGLRGALGTFEELGAKIVKIDLPHARFAVPAYYLAAAAEASSNLARYDGVRFGRRAGGRDLLSVLRNTRSRGFGREVKMRIMLGTFALSSGYRDEFYGKALAVRRLVAEDYAKAFDTVDLIAGPTSPVSAIGIGERIDDPLTMYLCDSLTTPASLAGIPAISLPCGLTAKNRPLGLQITGPALHDALVLRAARGFEKKRKGGPIRSPLAAGLEGE